MDVRAGVGWWNWMSLTDEFIQELKYKNDITDVISSYVSLKRRGRNLIGLCPFHSERTPSFYIYPSSSSFYCFGCGAGGDVITFIRLCEKLDYMEAVKFLADRAGIEMPINNHDDAVHKQKMAIYEINRQAARFYHHMLCCESGKGAMRYLLDRGLKIKTIKTFGLGYSPNSRYGLVNYLKSKGYDSESIVMANLAFKTRSGRIIDRFVDRVMYPIIDVRGNVVAFGGRLLGDGKPKYLNTSDTPVFKKSVNLFALNFAKTNTSGQLILAEGYMDVIALHQAGFKNTVATLGTALTSEQAKVMSRYAEEVIVCYDSDEAGQKAANRAINIFRECGVEVRIISIPRGKDPDEFMKMYGEEGPVRFKKIIEDSKNDVEYRLQKLRSRFDLSKSDDKVKYLTEASKILAELDNYIEREIYVGRLSEEIGIEKIPILMQVNKYKKTLQKNNRKKEFKTVVNNLSAQNDKVNPEKKLNLRATSAEEMLLSYLANNQDKVKKILSEISEDMFVTEFNRRVCKAIRELSEEGRVLDVTNISAKGFTLEETGRIAKLICGYVPGSGSDDAVREYISVIKQEKEKQNLKDVSKTDVSEICEYINKLKEIKK